MSPWFHFRARADFQSEQDLQGKLDLPRGAAVSGRKARALDDAEILSAHDPAGLPEVGVIEQVEELGAELQPRRFTDLCGLDDREVHVVEPRAGHDVASDIAEDRRTRAPRRAGRAERRLVEPGRRVARPVRAAPETMMLTGLPDCDVTMPDSDQPSVNRLPLNGKS